MEMDGWDGCGLSLAIIVCWKPQIDVGYRLPVLVHCMSVSVPVCRVFFFTIVWPKFTAVFQERFDHPVTLKQTHLIEIDHTRSSETPTDSFVLCCLPHFFLIFTLLQVLFLFHFTFFFCPSYSAVEIITTFSISTAGWLIISSIDWTIRVFQVRLSSSLFRRFVDLF